MKRRSREAVTIRRAFSLFSLALLFAGLAIASTSRNRGASAPPEAGTVVVVYDGDTVKVRFTDGSERKVRLIGIDSPEIDDARENVRFMAFVAKRFAFLKLYRAEVRLAYDWQLEDKYGRILAYITTADGVMFNELIVREGYAFMMRAFPYKPDLMKKFEAAEREARSEGRGLWRKGDPPSVPPSAARGLLGRIATVRMTCDKLERRRGFYFIHPTGDEMEALIPERRKAEFPDLTTLPGREFLVTGLVEEFDGRVQIVMDLPMQLKLLGPVSAGSALCRRRRFCPRSRTAEGVESPDTTTRRIAQEDICEVIHVR